MGAWPPVGARSLELMGGQMVIRHVRFLYLCCFSSLLMLVFA